MRAVSRLGLAMVAAGLVLVPMPALAQTVPDTTTNTPATDTIGPRELQNFNLGGTVTRPADTPAAPAAPPQSRSQPQTAPTNAERSATAAAAATSPGSRRPAAPGTASTPDPASASAPQTLALGLPSTTPASVAQPGFLPAPVSTTPSLEPDQKPAYWPWLLLAAVVGSAAAFLLWRRRPQGAYAGGAGYDAFVAPEPEPRPRAAPAPRLAPPPPASEPLPPEPVGIVSSRLRPWVDIAFAPIGCIVDDQRVTIEFEVQLTNTGSAPARDVIVEASMFNAGSNQEQDISTFFTHPAGQGERIQVIAPLQNVSIRTSLVAPRQNIQEFELGGRKVFVPLVAFNALYRLSSGRAQTSSAYMLGRETSSEKLGPLRADLGSKAFSNLGTRPLPIAVRN